MDFLKLIPQAFFDAIGRVVPGIFLIVCLTAITGHDIVRSLLEGVAPSSELRQSVVVWVLVVTTSSYIAGHFLSPFVKYLERVVIPKKPENKARRTLRERATYVVRWSLYETNVLLISIEAFVFPFRRRKSSLDTTVWKRYDWLRLEKPEVGGLVARLRAEYTMYGGLAAGLLLMCFVLMVILFNQWYAYAGTSWQFLMTTESRSTVAQIAAAAVGGELMAIRHQGTYTLFGLSVDNFYSVAKGSDRWKEEFEVQAPSVKTASNSPV